MYKRQELKNGTYGKIVFEHERNALGRVNGMFSVLEIYLFFQRKNSKSRTSRFTKMLPRSLISSKVTRSCGVGRMSAIIIEG